MAYAVLTWLLAALGVLHMASTWRLHSATPFTRVWFFGSGLAMAQAAALNLLNRRYGRSAPGLAWTTRAVNVVILAFAVVAGVVTGASTGELVVMLGVLAALLVLSWTPTAQRS
jgi:hypothetical protein